MSGPTTCVPAGHARGYSSCGNVATSASASADAAVDALQRRQPEPPARLVELRRGRAASPWRSSGSAPRHSARPAPRARQPRAAGVRRAAGRHARVEVGDDRPDRHALELARQRGREREDVGDHDGGGDLAHEVDGLARRPLDRLVGRQRPLAGGEDVVLGRGGEAHPLALDVLLPALPGLQRHRVAAGGELAAERDHRERVPGVAEGAEQDPRGAVTQAASSAMSRSCSSRSAFVNASGLTPSVPTPASR